eukprot:Gb_12611 [translate_table: standard]
MESCYSKAADASHPNFVRSSMVIHHQMTPIPTVVLRDVAILPQDIICSKRPPLPLHSPSYGLLDPTASMISIDQWFQLCKLNEFNWSHKQTFNGGAPSATNPLQTITMPSLQPRFSSTPVTMQHSGLPVAQKIDLLHIQLLPITMLQWGSDRYKYSQQL